jgi:outer membrane immunogenic protein
MKKFLLAGVAGAALVAGSSAHAADLGRPPPYKAPPPVVAPVPIFTWTGCYLGGHVGWGWGRKTASAPELAPGVSVSGDTSGFLGGGQVGCNYQLAPNWVIGIEGDGSAADIKGDVTDTVSGITGTAHARTDWIASATGRLGWAWDRWLIFAKGGAAWAGDKYSADIPTLFEHLDASETRSGWTVGGGVEWAFWYNWSAKLEYDFYDFGTRSVTFTGTIGPTSVPEVVPGIDVKQTISAVKFGINYRFDWGKGKAPVVARY